MVCSRWLSRAVAKSSASSVTLHRLVSPETRSARIASAPGAPPGSRVTTTPARSLSASASDRASVDLPAPSPPSRVMKRPCAIPSMCAGEGHAQALPGLSKPIGAADALAGDEREPLCLQAWPFDHEMRDHLSFRHRRTKWTCVDDV